MPLLMPTDADDDASPGRPLVALRPHSHGHLHGAEPAHTDGRWRPAGWPALTRRAALQASLAAAALPWLGAAAAQPTGAGVRPTADDAMGPFYPLAAADEDADLTAAPGRTDRARGTLLYLSGRVLDPRGAPVAGAVIEMWQANAAGRYAHPRDDNPAPLDPAFSGFARLRTDEQGRYQIKTVKPGEYPGRTPHLHFAVRGQRSRLVTQMYFEGEPRNERDGLLGSRSPASKATLISRWGTPGSTHEKGALVALWDVVLASG